MAAEICGVPLPLSVNGAAETTSFPMNTTYNTQAFETLWKRGSIGSKRNISNSRAVHAQEMWQRRDPVVDHREQLGPSFQIVGLPECHRMR